MAKFMDCTCGATMLDGGPVGLYCPKGFDCPDIGYGFLPVRPSWDDYGLALAKTVSLRADCRRAQHGAVILDLEHRVAGAGYNGYPAGVPGCLSGGCPRGSVPPSQLPHRAPYNDGIGRCDAIHAESNCIMDAPPWRRAGATIYVTGQPCHGCEVLIAGSGLSKAIWPGGTWERL